MPGDFNASHIIWQAGSYSVSSGFYNKLLKLFLFKAVTSPTGFKEGNNPSILGLEFAKYSGEF